MGRMKVIVVLLLCVGLLSGVWSCRTPAGRTAGEVVDDATINARVKARLFEDPILSGFAVSVDSFQGDVTLTGAVDSPAAKQRATEVARSVHGVRRVNNLLEIKEP